jgi:hypothetical protein
MASEQDVSAQSAGIHCKLTIIFREPYGVAAARTSNNLPVAGPSALYHANKESPEPDLLPTIAQLPSTPTPITPPPDTPGGVHDDDDDDDGSMSMSISSDAGSTVIGPLLHPFLVKGKILLQTAGLATATRNATPQLGMDVHAIAELGEEWKTFCEAWISAEIALQKQGGQKPCPLEDRNEKVPEALIRWFRIQKGLGGPEPDWVGFGRQMRKWWYAINAGVRERCSTHTPDNLVKEDWCVGGLSGIILFVLGMSQWGLHTDDTERNGSWKKVLGSLTEMLTEIPKATDL